MRMGAWRRRIHERLASHEGVVGVLMKPRNGLSWTPEEKLWLRARLVALARWTPVLLVLLLPGSVLLLPLVAWLLDRRRRGRGAIPA